jgi:UPF0755 protein
MAAATGRRVLGLSAFLFLLLLFVAVVASLPPDRKGAERVVVVRAGSGLAPIAAQLKAEGLIRSSSTFMVSALPFRRRLMAGEYRLSTAMSAPEIVRRMVRGMRNIYILTIREGDNIYDVAKQSEKAGIASAQEFLTVARDSTLNRRLGIGGTTLEGYLAPDTYHYSRETDLPQFLATITRRTTALFADRKVQARMAELHLDMHRTLTLASMIEREAQASDEKPLISSVFHNRLARGMSLDCDPTVIYGTGRFGSPITKADLATPTPYNTYRLTGLPAGPIANPDKTSIMAALYPAQTEYLYFVATNDGRHAFSKRMNEHNRYVMMYQRVKRPKQQ